MERYLGEYMYLISKKRARPGVRKPMRNESVVRKPGRVFPDVGEMILSAKPASEYQFQRICCNRKMQKRVDN